jgi:ABC-type transporter Mla subunit MlaD
MRLPVPGPRDLLAVLEKGADQVDALLGAVPRVLSLLDQAEMLLVRASAAVDQVEAVTRDAAGVVVRTDAVVDRAEELLGRTGGVVDRAEELLGRTGGVVDRAGELLGRTGGVVDRGEALLGRTDGLVDRGEALVVDTDVLVRRLAVLLDLVEGPLTTLQPTLQTLADTTHPEEVAALVSLVDQLPDLTMRVERDVLPVMTTLGTVAPDLHDLLDVSRELNEMLGKLPGLGRIKRRVEEEQEAEQQAEREAEQAG